MRTTKKLMALILGILLCGLVVTDTTATLPLSYEAFAEQKKTIPEMQMPSTLQEPMEYEPPPAVREAAEPEPEAAPEPEISPEPEAGPEPEITPEPEAAPEPEISPEPEITPEPEEPSETETPPEGESPLEAEAPEAPDGLEEEDAEIEDDPVLAPGCVALGSFAMPSADPGGVLTLAVPVLYMRGGMFYDTNASGHGGLIAYGSGSGFDQSLSIHLQTLRVTIDAAQAGDCPLAPEALPSQQMIVTGGWNRGYAAFENLPVRADALPGIYPVQLRVSWRETDDAEYSSYLTTYVEITQGSDCEDEAAAATIYPNSISGMLWVDMHADIDSGIDMQDGTFQAEETPLPGYSVALYRADDPTAPIKTTTTDASGRYEFTDTEPDVYLVGVQPSAIVAGVQYLPPKIGIVGDNQFAASDGDMAAYTQPIEMKESTAITGMDAAMRTAIELRALTSVSVTYIYYGRLVDQYGNPICNTQLKMAVAYNRYDSGGKANSTSAVTTDSSGNFYFTCTVSATTDAILWKDDISLLIHFPSPPFATYPGPTASYPYSINGGAGSLSTKSGGLSLFLSNAHGIVGNYYTLADYDLLAIDVMPSLLPPFKVDSFTLTIGSASSRQTITVKGASYIVTENHYGVDTGTTNLKAQKKSSYGTVFETSTFTGTPYSPFLYSAKTYTYVGYRINKTTGPLLLGNPSFPVTANVTVNYYYAPANYKPTAYEPEYASGSATSVNITGQYDLNGGTHVNAWLEMSRTGATAADFVSVGGTSNNSNSVALTENSLTPNTEYWYKTAIQTSNGSATSPASSFVTPPQLDTLVAVATGDDCATVSGTIALGTLDIEDVIITYAEDSAFSQGVVTLRGSLGEVTFDKTTYSVDLTGLTSGQTYYVKVVAKGPQKESAELTTSFTIGSCYLLTVPPILDFGVITISGNAQWVDRLVTNWTIQVMDARTAGDWALSASADPLTSADGMDTLPSALVFIQSDGSALPLSTGAAVAIAQRQPADLPGTMDVTWTQEKGLHLYLAPFEGKAGQEYTTTITWTLETL